jgi:CheY-like chemotaxis protein
MSDKIIVIEDEIPVQRLLAKLLTKMDRNYAIASDGEQGIKLIDESPETCAMVITDLILPNTTGWELLSYIEQNPLCGHIKTMVLTGANTSQEEIARLRDKTDAVLLKGDFTIDSFQKALDELLPQ